MSEGRPMKVLAADVGGTHARLALFRQEEVRGRPALVRQDEWLSEEHGGLLPILEAFLASEEVLPDAVCLAVAGPVREGRGRLPNLGWRVDAGDLRRATGIERLRLVNDFDAIARGVLLLRDDELAVLGPGDREGEGLVAVVGAGTGLGVAAVEPSAEPPRVHGSEGGHSEFAPVTEAEWALSRYLAVRHGRASWERVLSGDGLVEIFRHLEGLGETPELDAVRREMEDDDPAAVISRHGMAGDDPLSERALDMFVMAYGRFAGDVALTLGARGGVYVAGGIAPRIVDILRDGRFMEAFRSKGRMERYMAEIPVWVVLNQDVGLLGAAALGATTRLSSNPHH